MMRRCRAHLVRLALALLSATPSVALAWGSEGHQRIAEVAADLLTPAARAEALRLLALEPGSTLASISTWADEIRTPSTARWHYVNFERGACSYEAARECPEGQCVVGALDAQLQLLARGGDDIERLKALKWVVHLVADVHQPLHAAFGDDRGGNTFQVQAFGRGSNLHAVWDGGLISQAFSGSAGLYSEVAAAARLTSTGRFRRRPDPLGARIVPDRERVRVLSGTATPGRGVRPPLAVDHDRPPRARRAPSGLGAEPGARRHRAEGRASPARAPSPHRGLRAAA
jgi:hypothetical protein